MAVARKLTVQPRTRTGSAAARQLRRQGMLPAILMRESGHAEPVMLKAHEFEMFLKSHGREARIVDLEIDGQGSRKSLLKEIQRDPVTDAIIHVDFKEVVMTRKLRMRIPVKLVGAPVGVAQGGVLEQLVREVEVECLASDLVGELTVDVSNLAIGNSAKVSDIRVGPGLTILTQADIAVASVLQPRLEEEAPVAEAGPAEPELIRKEEKEAAEEEAEEKAPSAEKKADAKPAT